MIRTQGFRFLPLLLLAATSPQALASRIEWVQTPKHAFVLLPPTLVTDGVVQRADWSPDGAHLIMVTTPKVEPNLQLFLADSPSQKPTTPGIVTILGWDRARGEVKNLWSTDDPGIVVCDVNWLAGSSTVFVTMGEVATTNDKSVATFGLVAIDAETKKYAWVSGMEHLASPPRLYMSPLRPTALAVVDQTPEPIGNLLSYGERPFNRWDGLILYEPFRFGSDAFVNLGPGGAITHTVTTTTQALTNDSTYFQSDVAWNKDGSQWLLATKPRRHKGDPPVVARAQPGQKLNYYKLEETGQLASNPTDVYAPLKPSAPELVINTKPITAKQRTTTRGYSNLWVSSPTPTFHSDSLVTPNAQNPEFAPTEDAIFYIEGGIAKVRALQSLNDEQKVNFFKALKQEALQNAKQSVLGLIMFAGDNDDVLPGADNFKGILPYVGDPDIMSDFVYTPGANLNMTQIENPATTTIGYIDAPGGRVYAYSDGHCKFIPNP